MLPEHFVHAVHPALAHVFAAFDAAGIAWCLLRGESGIADPTGDVDLLVAASDLPRLDAALPAEGFLRVHAWGGHRSYVGYDAATDRFLELDIESDLDFGPSGHFAVNWLRPTLRTGAAAAMLMGRRRAGSLSLPDPDDAFWALLLHCIVDKRAVAPRHRSRLAELAAQARPDGVLGKVVSDHCPPGWDAERALAAAREARWSELVTLGAELPDSATPARRVAALGRGLSRLPDAIKTVRWGFSVAVMGPDGAGKSTLTRAIAASSGLPARLLYMGLWQGEGDCRSSLPTAALAAVRRLLRSWWRTAITVAHQSRGRLVVFDRHPYDALLPPSPPYVVLKRAFFMLLARTAPPPSLVLVLDLPAEVTARRRPDEDPAALAAARADYLTLARQLPRAVVVDADRAPDALRAEAVDRIWQALLAQRKVR
jgi:thymidylate kinase